MKKLFIISLILWWLFLTWCSQQKWLSQNELFEKKKDCAMLQDKMWEQLNSNERYWDSVEWTTLYLSEVFYSPIKNSCLYKSEFIYNKMYVLEINDYFTKNVLHTYYCDSTNTTEYSECSNILKEKIQEFKWE